MKCDNCVHRDKEYSNECEIFLSTDNNWNCNTTIEEYRQLLRDEINYLSKAKKDKNTDEDIERRKIIRDCQLILNDLDKYR